MTTSYTAAPTAAGYSGAGTVPTGNVPMPTGIDFDGQVAPPVHAEVPSELGLFKPMTWLKCCDIVRLEDGTAVRS